MCFSPTGLTLLQLSQRKGSCHLHAMARCVIKITLNYQPLQANWVLEYTFYVKGKFQGGHILISHVRRYTLLPYNTAILDLTLILNYNLKSH